MKHRDAFTLIELLVVIAIISLLAAILFPVFATAREKARQTTCTNNLKQIATAMSLYIQDYDENIPPCEQGVSTDPNLTTWDTEIKPYVSMGKQTQAGSSGQESTLSGNSAPWATCPDDTVRHAVSSGVLTEPARSYAMVQQSGPSSNLWRGSCGVAMSQIGKPDSTLLVVECHFSQNIVGYYNYTHADCPAEQHQPQTSAAYYPGTHSGGWNYEFCDGHVKWMNPEQTIGPNGALTCATSKGPAGMWTIDEND